MSQSPPAPSDYRWVLRRVVARIGPLVTFSVVFGLVETALLTPLAAAVVRYALDTWGRASVANFEIVSFLLSPAGLIGLIVLGAVQLATLHLRLAGLNEVLAGSGSGTRYAVHVVRLAPKLLHLGLRQVAVYLLVALPFLAALGIGFLLLWKPHDLNRLVVTRPPVFWYGVAGAGVLGLVYAVLAGRLYLRWLFAVPILLFEPGTSVPSALRTSVERTRGRLRSLAVAVVGCIAIFGALSLAVAWMLRVAGGWALDEAGESVGRVVAITAVVVAVNAVVAAVVSALSAIAYAGVVLARYRQAGGSSSPEPTERDERWWTRAGVVACVAVAALGVLAGWKLIRDARVTEPIEITAHRAGAKGAPENTVAALRRVIAAGADWAEIDVQFTSDGQIVVIHDTDLLRVGGSPLKVATSTLTQLREVDLGSPIGPEFTGERIPTLDEFLAAADGHIRLNIELKPNGPEDAVRLAEATVAAVRKAGMVGRCRICSQSYPGIRRAKELEPGLEIGFITGAAVGDLAGLDVDYLMVGTRLVTRDLVERAKVRGIAVHAWTVNDPDLLAPLIDRGTANIITDDPAAMRARWDELRQLDPVERLLLRVRNDLTSKR